MFNCETNREEKTLSTYDNGGKEKTSSTPNKEDKEAVHLRNGVLNINEFVGRYLTIDVQTRMHSIRPNI